MNKTAKSFSIVTGFSLLTRALAFLFKIWMSRALGAEVVGVYQIAQSVIFLLFTLTAGAPTVLSRKVAEAAVKGDKARENSLATASMVIGLSVAAVLVALFLGLKNHLGMIFSNEACVPIFLILLPTLVTSTLYATLRSWFWGRKNFIAFSSTELLDEIVKIILSIVFAGGITQAISPSHGIALAITISDLVCVIVLAVLFFASGGRLKKPRGFKELTRSMIPLSATRILTSLAVSMTALVIPKLLVDGGFSIAEATAAFGRVSGMALPLIMAPTTLISSLSIVLIPDVAGLKAQGDFEKLKSKLSSAMTFALLVAGVFFALYLPLGEPLGTLLFKDAEAGRYVSYCSAMLFPVAIAQVTTPMLNSLGKEKSTLSNTVIGGVVMIPLIFLTKFIGTYSIALASGTCFLTTGILNLVVLRREIGDFSDVKTCVKAVVLFVPLALIGYFSARPLKIFCGNMATTIVVAVFTLFFSFILVQAFGVVDIVGFLRLLRPTLAFGTRKNRRGQNRRPLACKTKREAAKERVKAANQKRTA